MRTGRPLVCGRWVGLLSGTWLAAASVWSTSDAQVTINNQALNSLGKPTHHAAPRRTTRRAPPHIAPHAGHHEPPHETPHVEPVRPPSAPVKPATPATVLPKVPITPPAILALPPPVVVPLAHPPPAPLIPEAADAPGTAVPIKGGTRVTFGPGRADFNPATLAALRAFARDHLGQTGTGINIYAYAAGSADDPSTPRRLSLERALAARAVLMKFGIPSPRIYPRALGAAPGESPADRVDVVAGAPTPPTLQGHATEGHAG
jgi:outer membrane protein OmpA-like peptidoglycan-associated protein